jgi:hypothetical protein
VEALAARRATKEIASEYSSDSNPASGYFSDSSYEFDFGSDPIDPESEINTTEEPLSSPATGLVITSTPAGRFVYWPDRKPADPTGDNSRCVTYLDILLFQEGTPLAPNDEQTPTEVATTESSLCTPDREVVMAAGDAGTSENRPTGTLTTSQMTSCPPTHLPMRLPTTRMLDVTTTESGTNDVDVSERLSLSGTSTRL